MTQSRAFAEEIISLGSANNKKVAKVKQNNKLYSLDTFVDEDQVLRALYSSYSVTQEWYCY